MKLRLLSGRSTTCCLVRTLFMSDDTASTAIDIRVDSHAFAGRADLQRHVELQSLTDRDFEIFVSTP